MSLCFLLPGLPDMQIPGNVLASRQIILLGTINWDVLLKLKPIPHTEEFNTTGIKQNTVRDDLNPRVEDMQILYYESNTHKREHIQHKVLHHHRQCHHRLSSIV